MAPARQAAGAGPALNDGAFWRRPARVGRAYADGRFGQIHYRIAQPAQARAIPVVFLHASPTSGRMYEPALAEIGRDRIALAPDTPGFGDSDAPGAPPEIADYAAALGEFVLALGHDRIDVVGYHTGSKIACELALQRPHLVRRIAMVSASIYSAEEVARQRRDFADPGIPRDGSHIAARWAFLMRWRKPDVPLVALQRAVAEYLKAGPLAHWGHRAAFNYAHAEHLPALTQSVLVFNFDDDLAEPTARAAQYLRNGRIINLPWAHCSIEVHAAEFARHLRRHFDAPGDDGPATGSVAKAIPPAPRAARPPVPIRRRFVEGTHGLVHLRETRPIDTEDAHAPLILLHAGANSGRMFESLQPLIGRHRRTLAIDMPGHGESDAPPCKLTIEACAGQLGALVGALGCTNIDVLGSHIGAQLAIELALQRPDLVRKVAVASAMHVAAEDREAAHANVARLAIRPDGGHDIERFRALWPQYPADIPGHVVARDFAESLRGGPLAWWGEDAAIDYALPDKWARVRQPALLLDAQLEPSPILVAAPHGQVRTLPGGRCGMFDVHAVAIAAILHEFLDS